MDSHTIIYIATRIIVLVLWILFHVHLQKTLETCSFHNRLIPPALVWLNFIPVFNLVWAFILNAKISGSIRKELEERQGHSDYDDYAFKIGFVYPSFMIISVILDLIRDPFPYATQIAYILMLSFITVYWSKTAEYKKEIKSMGENIHFKNDMLDGF